MLKELFFGVSEDVINLKEVYFLLGFIGLDIITGLIRAGKDRVLNSSINFDGLVRKAGIVLGVVFLTLVDSYLGTEGVITTFGVGALVFYEILSVIENFKQIGVNFEFIMKYFDKDKYEGGKK